MGSFRADRLLELRKALGVSQEELARRTRSTQPSINRLEAGGTSRPRNLVELARELQTTPEYLLGETDDPAMGSQSNARQTADMSEEPRASHDLVEIAQIDLRFGLGASIMDEEIGEGFVETRLFPKDWVRMISTSPPNMLYWALGRGNSMEPAIGDGDIILIDRSEVTPGFGDLYWAFAYGQTGMIKRLRPMPDGSVKILSDNQSVPPELAYDGELHIFGRVIAVVRKL